LSIGSSVITKRPLPLSLSRAVRPVPSAISAPSRILAVARRRSSESHSTTSRRTGPSPWICMMMAPLNFRLADSRAAAATISPSTVFTAAG
jgi:hypothetical protein